MSRVCSHQNSNFLQIQSRGDKCKQRDGRFSEILRVTYVLSRHRRNDIGGSNCVHLLLWLPLPLLRVAAAPNDQRPRLEDHPLAQPPHCVRPRGHRYATRENPASAGPQTSLWSPWSPSLLNYLIPLLIWRQISCTSS